MSPKDRCEKCINPCKDIQRESCIEFCSSKRKPVILSCSLDLTKNIKDIKEGLNIIDIFHTFDDMTKYNVRLESIRWTLFYIEPIWEALMIFDKKLDNVGVKGFKQSIEKELSGLYPLLTELKKVHEHIQQSELDIFEEYKTQTQLIVKQNNELRTNPRSLSPHILLLEISTQFLKIFEERMKPILADLGELKDYQYRAVKFEAGLHDLMTEGEGNSDILIYSKIYNNGIPMPNLCGMKIELDGKKWTGFIFNRSQLEQFLNICLNKQ